MLFLHFHQIISQLDDLAWVIVPIADATIRPLQLLDFAKTAKEHYSQLPFSREQGEYSCLRSHQLLFNELVKIKKDLKDEVEVEIFNVFYQEANNKRFRTFWLLKNNVKPLKELVASNKDISTIPHPYTRDREKSLKRILTLSWPWQDPVTKKSYSAGTRFVRASKLDTKEAYAISILDPSDFSVKLTAIPRYNAVVDYPLDNESCMSLFVNLLKKWANQPSLIPYVWGGCSFMCTYSDNNFSLVGAERFGKKVSYWTRPYLQAPVSGLECSALIFRVAQIYGMPYFYKNTTTIMHNLKALSAADMLCQGDIIWYPGHVLIVSDLEHNKVIESVGYLTGFGIVHEKPLELIFKGIVSYQDLLNAYRSHRSLKRLDITGKVIRSIENFLLLNMRSIWK